MAIINAQATSGQIGGFGVSDMKKPPIVLDTFNPPDGQLTVDYSYDSGALFEGFKVVYSVNGALPDGLSLSVKTGIISGKPTVANTFAGISITGTNLAGDITTNTADILIIA